MKTKPKHLTKQERRDIQAAHGGYPTLETVTKVRDDYARARWPKHTLGQLICHSGMIWKPDGTEDGTPIARMDRDTPNTTPVERDANAHRLALCWNTHDALVEALTMFVDLYQSHKTGDCTPPGCAVCRGRAALAAAKEQP